MPLYTDEFMTDPHRVYRELRDRHGPLAPVELAPDTPATVVLGYREALRILDDDAHYPADPRRWQQLVAPTCPVLPLLQWRPITMRTAGAEHTRLREACTAGLERVDLHALRQVVERTAISMIESFGEAEPVELLGQYAFPLTFQVLTEVLGLPPEAGQRALAGVSAVLDAADAESARRGNAVFEEILADVVRRKRDHPDNDLLSWLMAHPARLDDTEMVQQTAMLYGAGTEPTCGLITNALLLEITDDRFGGGVLGGRSRPATRSSRSCSPIRRGRTSASGIPGSRSC
ncbi:hypothetical protein [Nocardia sp. NPDC057227]|uniref:hypothetical protein n=1 Tax=Nocardia sp. NPDC057227 TaxID=3346056 RepID=UPI0036280B9D